MNRITGRARFRVTKVVAGDTLAAIRTCGHSRASAKNRTMNPRVIVASVLVALGSFAGCGIARALQPATTDEHGFRVHEIRSQFQAGTTRVRVLTPERLEAGRRYESIYVLPVEAGSGTQRATVCWRSRSTISTIGIKRSLSHRSFPICPGTPITRPIERFGRRVTCCGTSFR